MIAIPVIILVIFAWIVRYFLVRAKYRRLSDKWGCKAPYSVPNNTLGLQSFREFMQAADDARMSAHVSDLHHLHGKTFVMNVLGNDPVFTIEPDNVKAVLATQFEDFGMGIRHRQMYPLIGDGIFSLDGEGWAHSRALLRPQFTRSQVGLTFRLDALGRNMCIQKK